MSLHRLSKWSSADLRHSWSGHQSSHQFQRTQSSGPQEVHRWLAGVYRWSPGDGKVQDRVWVVAGHLMVWQIRGKAPRTCKDDLTCVSPPQPSWRNKRGWWDPACLSVRAWRRTPATATWAEPVWTTATPSVRVWREAPSVAPCVTSQMQV